MPRAKPEERRRKLQEKQARIKAELQRLDARERETERKRDTRRKILLGALLQDIMDRGEVVTTRREIIMAKLERFLERDRDRALFDLPPRAED